MAPIAIRIVVQPMRKTTNLRHVIPAVAIAALLHAPAAAAQNGSIIEDPAGDAGPLGVATPALADSFDLLRVWLHEEDEQMVTLSIATTQSGSAPASGEIAVHLEADGAWWIMGWTTVVFPAPPFTYQGGFFCPSDASAATDPATCGSVPHEFASDGLHLTIDREAFGLLELGTTIENPQAYAVVYDENGAPTELDSTAIGTTYTFQTGAQTDADDSDVPTGAPSGATATEVTSGDTETTRGESSDAQAPARTDEEASATPIVMGALVVASAAALMRRRGA